MGRRGLFIKNAAVLTASTLLLRGLGMVFRIVIANHLGAEGMGLYQIVVSVYMLASTLCSAGLSIAVTRLVSEEQLRCARAGLQKLMAFCLGVAAVLGAAVGAGLYLAAGALATFWIGEADAARSLQVLALSLPFMAVSACLRGYFTARRRIAFSSLSQLLEQGVKFGVCMGLIAWFGVQSTTFGCMLVMAADTVSEWFSFAFQFGGWRADCRRLPLTPPGATAATAATSGSRKAAARPTGPPGDAGTAQAPEGRARDQSGRGGEKDAGPMPANLARRLAAIALPIAGVRLISSALYTVENTLVPGLLERFAARTQADAHALALTQWGQLKGMGIPVVMFPSTLLASFVLLLVPELSEYRAAGRHAEALRLIGLSLHVTLAAAIGAAAGLYLLADNICEVLYPGQGIGFYVQVLAPLTPFMYLENVAEGMLKGLGEQKVTLRYSIVNVLVRLALILPLAPRWGMPGFLWMMLVDNVVTSLLHTCRVLNVMRLRVDWGHWVVRPLVAAAAAYGGGWFLRARLAAAGWQGLWLLAAVAPAMVLVYLAGLLGLGSFRIAELRALFGKR